MRRGLSLPQISSLVITPALLGVVMPATWPQPGAVAVAAGVAGNAGASMPGLFAAPAAVTGPGTLSAVAALSNRYAWAVGSEQVGSALRSLIARWNGKVWRNVLIEHWNGRSWRLDPASQPPQCGCVLLGVGASSARNAWAVGLDQDHLGFTDIVIEHWRGLRWRPVSSPVQQGLLTGVAAASTGRAWAVGSPDALNTSLIISWNGTAWH